MSTDTLENHSLDELLCEVRPSQPQALRWTRKAFYELMELRGMDRMNLELIEGEIVNTPPQSNLHGFLLDNAADILRTAFGPSYWVRPQLTLDLSSVSCPDPDIAVVKGSRQSWSTSIDNPTTAILVVEVSVTTVHFDRRRKASMYAKYGIQEYWIIDPANQRLEVRRQPMVDPAEPYGHAYAEVVPLKAGDHVSPLALPDAQIQVADFLPRQPEGTVS